MATNLYAGDFEIVSFGYLHGPAPEADATFDVRRYLSDPAAVRAAGLLDSDGLDPVVQQVVLDTPGASETIAAALEFAFGFPQARRCVIAFGCAGGRHRSAALAEVMAEDLRHLGFTVTVRHQHIHLPRVVRPADDTNS